MRKRIVLLAVLLGMGVACSATEDHLSDATVTTCTPGANDGQPVAEGQVTNTSSKTSNYTIRIGFYDAAGNKVTDGGDVITGVEAGSASPWQATGAGSVKGPVTCKVLGVTRNVSPGG